MRTFTLTVVGLLLAASGYASAIYDVQISGQYTDASGTEQNLLPQTQSGSMAVSVTAGNGLPSSTDPYASYSAEALAGPNDLGVYGNVTSSGIGPSGILATSGVLVDAELNDSLYLSNAPSSGSLALYVDVEGLSIALSNNLGTPITQVGLFADGENCVGSYSGSPPAPDCGVLEDGINVLHVPYVNGNAVPLDLFFTATDECDSQVGGSCIAASEFLDTAQIASIVVEDSNGNPVAGATATSTSGVSYTPATPEPESVELTILGAASLLWLARCTSKRQLLN